jgi:hypothetical protein
MEEAHEPSPQEAEAASNHLDWRCDHFHWGAGESKTVRRAAQVPHRHTPFQQAVLNLSSDLLGSTPVRWTVEWAGPDLRCRGIEVTSRRADPDDDAVGRWVADPGTATGSGEPPAARVLRWHR